MTSTPDATVLLTTVGRSPIDRASLHRQLDELSDDRLVEAAWLLDAVRAHRGGPLPLAAEWLDLVRRLIAAAPADYRRVAQGEVQISVRARRGDLEALPYQVEVTRDDGLVNLAGGATR